MKCDDCKYYQWYYDHCLKWDCEVDARACHGCFEPNVKTDIEKLNDSIRKLKDASDSCLDALKSYNEKLKSILEDVKTW